MKILLVVSRWPWPPRRGDQLRALQAAEFLAAEHEVTLLAPAARPRTGDARAPAATPFRLATYRRSWWAPAAGALRALAGGFPFQSALFYQPDLGLKLRRLSPAADLVVLQLVRLAPSPRRRRDGSARRRPDRLPVAQLRRAAPAATASWFRPVLAWRPAAWPAGSARLIARARRSPSSSPSATAPRWSIAWISPPNRRRGSPWCRSRCRRRPAPGRRLASRKRRRRRIPARRPGRGCRPWSSPATSATSPTPTPSSGG